MRNKLTSNSPADLEKNDNVFEKVDEDLAACLASFIGTTISKNLLIQDVSSQLKNSNEFVMQLEEDVKNLSRENQNSNQSLVSLKKCFENFKKS